MAMIMIVLGFARAYADMGIGNAIIYRQDVKRAQLSSLYWLNIISGVVVFVLVIGTTPLVVNLYQEPRLRDLMIWAALMFLVTPLGQQFQILLQKEMRFRELSVVEIVSMLVGAVIAVFSAIAGQGVFSLIWGQLSGTTTKALLLFGIGWREWRPRLHFDRGDLDGYIGFGLYQMGERSINYLGSRVDQLLMGTFFGAQTLGYYNLAFNLVIQPVVRINPILTRVAFPVFAIVQSDIDRLRVGYMTVLKVIAMVNFPILFGLAAVAPLLIPTLFGEQWLSAVILVQLLGFVAVLRAMGNPVGSLLLARGRADLGFKWNLILFLTKLPGVSIGAYLGGAIGVVLALIVLQLLYTVISYRVLIRRLIGECLSQYLASVVPALVLSLSMTVAVVVFANISGGASSVKLVGQVFIGVIVYSVLNVLFQRQELQRLRRLVVES